MHLLRLNGGYNVPDGEAQTVYKEEIKFSVSLRQRHSPKFSEKCLSHNPELAESI